MPRPRSTPRPAPCVFFCMHACAVPLETLPKLEVRQGLHPAYSCNDSWRSLCAKHHLPISNTFEKYIQCHPFDRLSLATGRVFCALFSSLPSIIGNNRKPPSARAGGARCQGSYARCNRATHDWTFRFPGSTVGIQLRESYSNKE
jgi:hypothetical protein